MAFLRSARATFAEIRYNPGDLRKELMNIK